MVEVFNKSGYSRLGPYGWFDPAEGPGLLLYFSVEQSVELSLLLHIHFNFAGSETMPGDGLAGSGCTRVVSIVPVRPLPVVPGGRVRAPKGPAGYKRSS